MIINFKNVVFLAHDFVSAVAEGKTLYIYVGSKTLDIDFKNAAEAEQAKNDLFELLNKEFSKTNNTDSSSKEFTDIGSLFGLFGKNKDEVLDSVSSSVEKLTSKLDKLFSTVQSKAKKTVLDTVVNKAATSFESRVDSMVNELSDALSSLGIIDSEDKKEPVTKDSPNTKAKTKKRRDFTPDVFGSTPLHKQNENVERIIPAFTEVAGTPDEPLIGDLTQPELEDYIEQFMQDVLSNERVQDMFQSILSNFDSEKASEALSGYKKVVLTIALQNPELTLTQVIQNYFM